ETYKKHKGWMKNPGIVALSALNMAEIYMRYYPPWYKDSITNNIGLAIKASKELKDVVTQANCYALKAQFYIRQAYFKKARQALLKEEALLHSLDAPNYFASMNLYYALAKLEEKTQHPKQSLAYY